MFREKTPITSIEDKMLNEEDDESQDDLIYESPSNKKKKQEKFLDSQYKNLYRSSLKAESAPLKFKNIFEEENVSSKMDILRKNRNSDYYGSAGDSNYFRKRSFARSCKPLQNVCNMSNLTKKFGKSKVLREKNNIYEETEQSQNEEEEEEEEEQNQEDECYSEEDSEDVSWNEIKIDSSEKNFQHRHNYFSSALHKKQSDKFDFDKKQSNMNYRRNPVASISSVHSSSTPSLPLPSIYQIPQAYGAPQFFPPISLPFPYIFPPTSGSAPPPPPQPPQPHPPQPHPPQPHPPQQQQSPFFSSYPILSNSSIFPSESVKELRESEGKESMNIAAKSSQESKTLEENSHLKDLLHLTKEKVEELEKKENELKQELQKAKDENIQLFKDLQNEKNQLRVLQEEKENEFKKLEETYQNQKDNIEECYEKKKEEIICCYENKIQLLKEEACSGCLELRKEKKEMQDKIVEIKKKKENSDKEIEILKSELKKKKNDFDCLESTNVDLLTEMQEMKNSLYDKIRVLEKELQLSKEQQEASERKFLQTYVHMKEQQVTLQNNTRRMKLLHIENINLKDKLKDYEQGVRGASKENINQTNKELEHKKQKCLKKANNVCKDDLYSALLKNQNYDNNLFGSERTKSTLKDENLKNGLKHLCDRNKNVSRADSICSFSHCSSSPPSSRNVENAQRVRNFSEECFSMQNESSFGSNEHTEFHRRSHASSLCSSSCASLDYFSSYFIPQRHVFLKHPLSPMMNAGESKRSNDKSQQSNENSDRNVSYSFDSLAGFPHSPRPPYAYNCFPPKKEVENRREVEKNGGSARHFSDEKRKEEEEEEDEEEEEEEICFSGKGMINVKREELSEGASERKEEKATKNSSLMREKKKKKKARAPEESERREEEKANQSFSFLDDEAFSESYFVNSNQNNSLIPNKNKEGKETRKKKNSSSSNLPSSSPLCDITLSQSSCGISSTKFVNRKTSYSSSFLSFPSYPNAEKFPRHRKTAAHYSAVSFPPKVTSSSPFDSCYSASSSSRDSSSNAFLHAYSQLSSKNQATDPNKLDSCANRNANFPLSHAKLKNFASSDKPSSKNLLDNFPRDLKSNYKKHNNNLYRKMFKYYENFSPTSTDQSFAKGSE